MRFVAGESLFVDIKDLVFIGNLPNYVISEMKANSDYKGLEEFKNDDSKKFFESRREIINYDEIDNLSEEEIYDLIHNLYEEYFRLYKVNKTIFIDRKMEICEHKVSELKDYIDYKKVYDKKYKKIKVKKLVKED
ncbi:MAG: hypothetical protein IJH20_04630 [Bacilli bacterium]|nr:hypothetical protein [Bacilli bacterium]